jgi:predicted dienelactone hydrolase
VVGIETNSRFDQPTSRGSQLIAALNWAVNSSPTQVRSRVDGSRRGVAGHSMGGGGTLSALSGHTGSLIKAGVPLAPWNTDKTWSEVTEPVMIVGGSADTIAPDGQHSIPFYNSLGGQKASSSSPAPATSSRSRQTRPCPGPWCRGSSGS